MERAYEAAFDAHRRCPELLDSHLLHKLSAGDPLGFPVFGVPEGWQPERLSEAELDAIWLDAIAEDFQTDHLAATIVLTADDSLSASRAASTESGRNSKPATARSTDLARSR